MKMPKKEKHQFQVDRAKMELRVELVKKLNKFKSKEEPDIKLNRVDKIGVLADLISSYTTD